MSAFGGKADVKSMQNPGASNAGCVPPQPLKAVL